MKRILGLDHGEKRIGLAVSDPLQIIAKPLKTINVLKIDNIIDIIKEIVIKYNIEKIIVGYPLTLKNKMSIQTNKVVDFIDFLKKNIPINIEAYDERLSSQIAKKSLVFQGVKTGHNKSDVDKTAAAIFLQNYLDDVKK